MSPERWKLIGLVGALAAFLVFATPALARDRNHDRLPDGWETQHGLSLKKKQAKSDPDRDRLSNRDEFHSKTKPLDADTDNDGRKDGDEIDEETDPRDPDSDNDGLDDGFEFKIDYDPLELDTDGDGIVDGQENIGHIAYFGTGRAGTRILVDVLRGGYVGGRIDQDTFFSCLAPPDAQSFDGTCSSSDLVGGALVSDVVIDEEDPSLVDEVDIVIGG